jgi:uncharacterized protein YhfF
MPSIIESRAHADCSARFFEAFHFDDNESDANALADLVLAGVKQATVTYWDGRPACVIETLEVEVFPFKPLISFFCIGVSDACTQ